MWMLSLMLLDADMSMTYRQYRPHKQAVQACTQQTCAGSTGHIIRQCGCSGKVASAESWHSCPCVDSPTHWKLHGLQDGCLVIPCSQ